MNTIECDTCDKLKFFSDLIKLLFYSIDKVVFCYYSSFAQNRKSIGKFLPEDIDPLLCTHVIFAFVEVANGQRLKQANKNDVSTDADEGKM